MFHAFPLRSPSWAVKQIKVADRFLFVLFLESVLCFELLFSRQVSNEESVSKDSYGV